MKKLSYLVLVTCLAIPVTARAERPLTSPPCCVLCDQSATARNPVLKLPVDKAPPVLGAARPVVRRHKKPTLRPTPALVAGPKGARGERGEAGLKGDAGERGEPGMKGDKGDPGETRVITQVIRVRDGAGTNPIFGLGYRVTVIDSQGRPTATSYGLEAQLRLALDDRWELSFGGSYISGGDNAVLLHGSLDWYPSADFRWFGFSLGVHGQWYGILDNLARGQIIGIVPAVVLRTPPLWGRFSGRCEFAPFIGSNGFFGGRQGASFAFGTTAACGLNVNF